MRVLFVGGFARGFALLKQLRQSNAHVVGAYIFTEDAHEEVQVSEAMLSFCSENSIPATKTRRFSAQDLTRIRVDLRPDVIFCLGWRMLFPDELLDLAPRGVLAAHDSLLPRLRGFAPTNWGLLLGHDNLGVTLFRMTREMDDGDILFQETLRADPDEPLVSILDRVADASVRLFDRYLEASQVGEPVSTKQDHTRATFTCARNPDDGLIDWTWDTNHLARFIRALSSPAPGAFTFYDGERLKILLAEPVENPKRYEGRIPGRVIGRDPAQGSVDVLTGDGILRLTRVQREGHQPQPASEAILSVRKSLGANPAIELHGVRAQLRALEDRLAKLESNRRLDEAEVQIASH